MSPAFTTLALDVRYIFYILCLCDYLLYLTICYDVRKHCFLLLYFPSFFSDNVEMEIVLPGDMTVRESHDIALELQHKIEGLEEVERAFVHVRTLVMGLFVVSLR